MLLINLKKKFWRQYYDTEHSLSTAIVFHGPKNICLGTKIIILRGLEQELAGKQATLKRGLVNCPKEETQK